MSSDLSAALASLIGLFALAALLAHALWSDLRTHRIPNRTVLAGLAAAAALHLVAQVFGTQSLAGERAWSPLLGLLAGGALLLPLYMLRLFGAGDVKLMAMVGAFVGAPTVLWATLYTFVAGGLLAATYLLLRPDLRERVMASLLFQAASVSAPRVRSASDRRIGAPFNSGVRVPYALAIALGTAAAVFTSPAARGLL
jgi:prepilin peptidase CpaA